MEGNEIRVITGPILFSEGFNQPFTVPLDPMSMPVEAFTDRDPEIGVVSIGDEAIRGYIEAFFMVGNAVLESLNGILGNDGSHAMCLFLIFDGLDEAAGDTIQGEGINLLIGGEYSFHCTR